MHGPQVWTTRDPAAFLARARGFLERDEVENNLALGKALRALERGEPGWFAVAERGGEPRGAAVLPGGAGGGLALAGADPEVAAALADAAANGTEVSSVTGPTEAVDAFAARHPALSRVARDLRLHRLERLIPPPGALPGTPPGADESRGLRAAEPSDEPLVAEWIDAFVREVDLTRPVSGEVAPGTPGPAVVREGRMYLWDDGGPVAMTAWSRRTARGVNLGLVYTPPAHRGRGYASHLVAALTAQLLEGGSAFCVLFTDAANPISNRIYARLGYEHVRDFRERVLG